MHEYEYVRKAIDDLGVEMRALREANADVHVVLSRVDERLGLVHEQIDRRLEQHSDRHEDTAARVIAIERQVAFVRAWSVGAGTAVTFAVSALAYVISTIPAHAWAAILGAGK